MSTTNIVQFYYFSNNDEYNSYKAKNQPNKNYLYLVGGDDGGYLYKGNELIAYNPTSILDSLNQVNAQQTVLINQNIQDIVANTKNIQGNEQKIKELEDFLAGLQSQIDNSISVHNQSSDAHTDIRDLVNNLNDNLNTFKTPVNTHIEDKDIHIDYNEKLKLGRIQDGAEINQNAFSNIKIGNVTLSAQTETDTLSFVAGSNITLSTDTSNDSITISTKEYDKAGSNLGLVKSGGDVTISEGIISVNDNSHSHKIDNVDGLSEKLEEKVSKDTTINGYSLNQSISLKVDDIQNAVSSEKFNEHVNEEKIHVTSDEKTSWNNKLNKSDVDTNLSKNSTNPVQNNTITNWIDSNVRKYSLYVDENEDVSLLENNPLASTRPPESEAEGISTIAGLPINVSWNNINGVPSASTSTLGVVKLSDAINIDSSTVAATSKAVKEVNDKFVDVNTSIDNIVNGTTKIGSASTSDIATKATQDGDGNVITSTYAKSGDFNTLSAKFTNQIGNNTVKTSVPEGAVFTDTIYTHPTYTARTGNPTENQTPGFGQTATISQIISDTTGHITGVTDRAITIPNTMSNGTETAGLIKTTSTVTSDNGYIACPVINGVPYYKGGDVPNDLVSNINSLLSDVNHIKDGTIAVGKATNDADGKSISITYETKEDATKKLNEAKEYTNIQINALIDGAPDTLDTLKEIADALTEDDSAIGKLTASIGEKASASDLNNHINYEEIHVTSSDKNKWNQAEANQNAFSKITVGDVTLDALNTTDTVIFKAQNVDVTANKDKKEITFSVNDGSTLQKGLVKLTDEINSSTTTAATPNSVKTAYDKADSAYKLADSKVSNLSDLNITASATELNQVKDVTGPIQTQLDDKLSKSGGTMTGDLTFSNKGIIIGVNNNTDQSLLKVHGGTDGEYGFRLQYNGTGTENNNSLSLIADNQTGDEIEAITMLQDGSTTFTKTITASGGVSGNASSATKVYSTVTNPSSGTYYRVPMQENTTSSKNVSLLHNDGFRYWVKQGTTSTNGVAELMIGNSTKSGEAGNKYGIIDLYGTSSGYTTLKPSNNTESNVTINLPTGAGTLALLTDNVASATKATKDSDGNVITSTYAKAADLTSLSTKFTNQIGDCTVQASVPKNAAFTDTKYGATGGIKLESNNYQHTNSVTAKNNLSIVETTEPAENATTFNFGGTIRVPIITGYDAQGHVTASGTQDLTLQTETPLTFNSTEKASSGLGYGGTFISYTPVKTTGHTMNFEHTQFTLPSKQKLSLSDTASTATLSFGGSIEAVNDVAVSASGDDYSITTKTKTYTLPSETAVSIKTAGTATGAPGHGKTFTAITALSSSNHSITPTVTTYTLPSETTLSGGSAAANDATVVGGVTVSGHAVTVGKKTITAGSNITVTGGTSAVTIAASNNKTAQNNVTTSGAYRVLLSNSANNNNETAATQKSGNLTFNPSTGELSTTKITLGGASLSWDSTKSALVISFS